MLNDYYQNVGLKGYFNRYGMPRLRIRQLEKSEMLHFPTG